SAWGFGTVAAVGARLAGPGRAAEASAVTGPVAGLGRAAAGEGTGEAGAADRVGGGPAGTDAFTMGAEGVMGAERTMGPEGTMGADGATGADGGAGVGGGVTPLTGAAPPEREKGVPVK